MATAAEPRAARKLEAKEIHYIFRQLRNSIKKSNVNQVVETLERIPNVEDLIYIATNADYGVSILQIANTEFMSSFSQKRNADRRRNLEMSAHQRKNQVDDKYEALKLRVKNLSHIAGILAFAAGGKYPKELCGD